MRLFADPVFFSVTDESWENNEYEDIFLSLKAFTDRMKELEDGLGKNNIFRFRCTDELRAQYFQTNPFSNSPMNYSSYATFYKDFFNKEIGRRILICPDDDMCNAGSSDNSCEISTENNVVPAETLKLWKENLEICGICGNTKEKMLLCPKKNKSKIKPDDYFKEKISEPSSLSGLVNIAELFRRFDRIGEFLTFGIRICYEIKVKNRIWGKVKAQNFEISDNFIRTLKREDIEKESDDYINRLIDSLTQVVYNRDDSIRIHSYSGEFISIDKKRHTKMSADVYQMGEGIGDNRCSRVFYYKERNKVFFHEYCANVH